MRTTPLLAIWVLAGWMAAVQASGCMRTGVAGDAGGGGASDDGSASGAGTADASVTAGNTGTGTSTVTATTSRTGTAGAGGTAGDGGTAGAGAGGGAGSLGWCAALDISHDATRAYTVVANGSNFEVRDINGTVLGTPSPDAAAQINYALRAATGRGPKNVRVTLENQSATWTVQQTIELPSYVSLINQGTLKLPDNASFNIVGNTSGGSRSVEMIGGTYDANKAGQPPTTGTTPAIRAIRFKQVSYSRFEDLVAQNAPGDGFVLDGASDPSDALSSHCNLVKNVTGRDNGPPAPDVSDGNGLSDRGHHNTWLDCRAEGNASDGLVVKSNYSTFINCTVTRNGISPTASVNGAAAIGLYEDRPIVGNVLLDIHSYGNRGRGISLNIPSNRTSRPLKQNCVQGEFYDNTEGVLGRNVQTSNDNSDNKFDVLVYGNTEIGFNIASGDVVKYSGVIVAYGNGTDLRLRGSGHVFDVYAPEGQATMSFGSNQVTFRDVSCTDADPAPWSVHRYCELLGTPRPGPVASVCDPTP